MSWRLGIMIKSYILPQAIEEYAEEHTSAESLLLKKLEKETIDRTESPQMLCVKSTGEVSPNAYSSFRSGKGS
jgi:hypothetical protein